MIKKKNFQRFQSPTWGLLNFKEVVDKIILFIEQKPDFRHRIVIGTDSQPKNKKGIDFVSALIVHRIGGGGVYFWTRSQSSSFGEKKRKPIKRIKQKFLPQKEKLALLRQRIYEEATLSLELAQLFIKNLKKEKMHKYDLEIHVDIGKEGETREMIAEVVGMVRGSGFNVKTKPEAYGASSVADRYA